MERIAKMLWNWVKYQSRQENNMKENISSSGDQENTKENTKR